jgi:hypothetical protein
MRAFSVKFSPPDAGWIRIEIESGRDSFADTFSHIYPSISELCGALTYASRGVKGQRARFLLEPAELVLGFEPDGGTLTTRATLRRRQALHPQAEECLFVNVGPLRTVVLTFWRALRVLQTSATPEQFELAWREAFPEHDMESFTDSIAHLRAVP